MLTDACMRWACRWASMPSKLRPCLRYSLDEWFIVSSKNGLGGGTIENDLRDTWVTTE